MEPAEALALIKAHDEAVTKIVLATGNIHGRGMAGAKKNLNRSVTSLFKALVGRKPTEEELAEAQVE